MKIELEEVVSLDVLPAINYAIKTVKNEQTIDNVYFVLKHHHQNNSEFFKSVILYRGGSHIAIINKLSKARVLLITE